MTRDEKMFAVGQLELGTRRSCSKRCGELDTVCGRRPGIVGGCRCFTGRCFTAAVILESSDRNDKVLCLKYNNPSSYPTLLLPAHIHPLFLRKRTPAF